MKSAPADEERPTVKKEAKVEPPPPEIMDVNFDEEMEIEAWKKFFDCHHEISTELSLNIEYCVQKQQPLKKVLNEREIKWKVDLNITMSRTLYFKGRKYRETEKSRNFAHLSFAIFTFWRKFAEKTFAKIFIFNSNNFREWLEKVNKKLFQISLLKNYRSILNVLLSVLRIYIPLGRNYFYPFSWVLFYFRFFSF